MYIELIKGMSRALLVKISAPGLSVEGEDLTTVKVGVEPFDGQPVSLFVRFIPETGIKRSKKNFSVESTWL